MLRALAGRVHSSEARAREWMTAEPIAVSRATTLKVAAILMTEHDIHHLPVVEGKRPVGMVGMSDVVRSAPPFRRKHERESGSASESWICRFSPPALSDRSRLNWGLRLGQRSPAASVASRSARRFRLAN
jgi:CBS-domain-containing membrane protein